MSEQEGAQQPAPVELVSLAAPPATQEVREEACALRFCACSARGACV